MQGTRRFRVLGSLTAVAGLLLLVTALAAPRQQQSAPASTSASTSASTAPSGLPSGNDTAATAEALFKTQVNLVVLHATVHDRNRRLVTGLPQEAFQVFQDGNEQRVTQFSNRDIPVSMGIVIDASASMIDKRASVNAAALQLVRASNPEDEIFILNFRDTPELAQDYTSDIAALERGLSEVRMWGGTALVDSLYLAVEHLLQASRDKKVLLAITDGEDDASSFQLQDLLVRLQKADVTVYTIGILSQQRSRARRNAEKMLKAIAKVSGGEAYFPASLHQVAAVAGGIARDIRNQYVLAYPVPSGSKPGFRSIQVKARAAKRGRLTVRTRPGYFHEPDAAAP
ncbi:MAG: VWA domain-containing protein [Acidobacteria bacterium]|nr:VWA domain-containing protein [Acidobacteriota bacterium]